MKKVKTIARPNIALIKYWGKRDEKLNLPAVGSISITLDGISTKTEISLTKDIDKFYLNEKIDIDEHSKITPFLDYIREYIQDEVYFEIHSTNNFPTAAGLASSASGYASIAQGINHLLGLNLSNTELSKIARRGSGSAARSIFGGIVEMHKGIQADGSDCYAEQLYHPEYFPLDVIVVITNTEIKKTSSRNGMWISKNTSPYYSNWVNTSDYDINAMKIALREKDFNKIADLSIRSCLKMHSVMMTSNPPLMYWNSTTFEIIKQIEDLFYEQKQPVFFTIDAGPQVKLITIPDYKKHLLKFIKKLDNIQDYYVLELGNGAEIIED